MSTIVYEVNWMFPLYLISHRAHRPSPADEGVDQIRNKKLQIHACAHKRVSVFTVTDHQRRKGPFFDAGLGEAFDRLRLSVGLRAR